MSAEDLITLVPLEDRMQRLREALGVLKDVKVPYMSTGWFYGHAMSRAMVQLFIDVYDGKPHQVLTNSTFFKALQKEPRVVEILGSLLHLQPHQLRYIRSSK